MAAKKKKKRAITQERCLEPKNGSEDCWWWSGGKKVVIRGKTNSSVSLNEAEEKEEVVKEKVGVWWIPLCFWVGMRQGKMEGRERKGSQVW